MEPLEATAIVSAHLQIRLVLHVWFNRPAEYHWRDAPVVNRFLINNMLCYGLFVGWHYCRGSEFNSEFWRYARDIVWPRHRKAAAPSVVNCDAQHKFDQMIELIRQPVIGEADLSRMCGVPLSSYEQMSRGLDC